MTANDRETNNLAYLNNELIDKYNDTFYHSIGKKDCSCRLFCFDYY